MSTHGIGSFRLDGIVDGKRVRAVWDGSELHVTDVLYDRAALAVAIDEVLDDGMDAGHARGARRSTLTGPPSHVALTLARCCDEITAAEYTCCGHRRVIAS